jgi:SPP1 gp7 family putative phage head morphogenesis protein
LVSSIAEGKNPNVVAREIRTALGGNLTRSLTIARTETLRAYREASRAEYLANADVLRGWIWTADLSNRTCAACWAQHGSVHPLGEIMATHPRCRCSMVPATRSWKELGFGSTPESVQIQEGPAIFRRLPESDQRAILGDAKYRAYSGRQITLPDLVAKRESPVWGPSTSEAGLGAAKDNAAARRLGDR